MVRTAVAWLLVAKFFYALGISPPSQVKISAGYKSDVEVAFTWLTDDLRDDATSCEQVAAVEISHIKAIRADFECLRYTYHQQMSNDTSHVTSFTSGRIHRVRAAHLVPDTDYQYRLAGDPDGLNRTFRTLPATLQNAPAYPLAFGVVGDLGQSGDSLETVRQLDADPEIRMILHAGDTAYADSNATRWGTYDMMVEPLSSKKQWMVCPGNHEIESDATTGYSFIPYEARFNMPRVKPPVNSPSSSQLNCQHPWPPVPHSGPDCTPSIFTQGSYDWGNSFYAYSAGPSRVVSLNSYTDTSPGSPQHNFLLGELGALRREETPWLIVQVHCPLYSSSSHHVDEAQVLNMKKNGFEDLFFQHNVAIVLAGHVHAYERSSPVYRNELNEKGPTYIVIGDGGNREGHADDYLQQPSWSAFRNGTRYGHGKITLVNNTHMKWDWMGHDPTGAVLSESASAEIADRHARAGAMSAAGASSPWRSSLTARSVDDSAWIVNPWSAATVEQTATFV